MSKVLTARYDASTNVLHLEEPLEGVKDHEKVEVTVKPRAVDPARPWLALEGSLSPEAGESLSLAVEHLFGDNE